MDVLEVDPIAAKTLVDKSGAILLDVREDDEWAAGHAPEAVHVPMSQFLSRLDDVPEGPLAVVCRVGGRSAQVTA